MQGQRTCVACEKPLERRANEKPGRFARRQTCDRTCGGRIRANAIAKYVVEDRGYETPCWVWTGGLSSGYGTVNQDIYGEAKAHRVYYVKLVGPVPDGLDLDHLCRVRACVNPAHLEPVTFQENVRRGANAKLTMEKATDIRSRRDEDSRALAVEFGVSRSAIYRIWQGTTWGEPMARSTRP